MSDACSDSADQLCGCCNGLTVETPEVITNRPVLSTVSYRIGRYGTFNASMLASLSDSAFTPLGLLRTRNPNDFSIALLDAWAVTLDVLSFYQERFANEAFLRTAVDQRSVFELARLVGYVPSPGVSASATLSFTLSSAPGSPDNVLIPAGTRVQSVPGPGQKPQMFETSADLTAAIGHNALPAQTSNAWQIAGSDTGTWFQGVANKLNVGDALLFVRATAGQANTTGPGDVRYITSVQLDAASNTTRVGWNAPLSGSFPAGLTAADVCIYAFRKKAALYGVQAPNASTLPDSVVKSVGGYNGAGNDWNYRQYTDGSRQINLDAAYAGLAPSADAPGWLVLTGLGYTSFFRITAAAESNPNLYTLTSKTTQLTVELGQIITGDTHLSLDQVLYEFVLETRDITAYVQSDPLTPARSPRYFWAANPGFQMQTGMIAPVAGSNLAVIGGQRVPAGQPLGVSGKRVRLTMLSATGATFTPVHTTEALPAATDQVFLIDAYPPMPEQGGAVLAWSVLTVSGVAGTLRVAQPNFQLSPADKNDPVVAESALVAAVAVAGDVTTLQLNGPLSRLYDAQTAFVNANSVQATNGETMQEILGSGDSTQPALQFTLKQSPLTYVSAASGNGTQSTLEVWVNNLEWSEVSNLLDSGPADRVFVTRVNAAGNVVIQFGDGTQGARPPTGLNNIRAVYRKGIGAAGMVAAGQLSQPLDRPQGLTSVINPGAASGAADPASADDARLRAPLPTLTIDRVVSLEDYQNFALNFAGISKAVASWTWFGTTRGVFLTVAGAGGARLDPDDPVLVHLILSLRQCSNPFVPLQVISYSPVLFEVGAGIRVDDTQYDVKQVLAQVWQNLVDHFAFERRQLGQNIAASEVIDVIQQTPGVVALQLRNLGMSGSPMVAVPELLCAAGPMPPAGAQMLLLDPLSQAGLGVWK